MRLYTKGLLAFTLVVIIAVGGMIWLVGGRTQTEFRQYSVLNSSRAQNLANWLINYYRQTGSWDGLQAALGGHATGGQGKGQGAATGQWDYQVADVEGVIVGDSTASSPSGSVSNAVLHSGMPLYYEDNVVGYLIPSAQSASGSELDEPAQQFLTEVRQALIVGGLVAFIGAMGMAVVLMRGIVNPVRDLTAAAEQVAQGDLNVRASTRGNDEIATLSVTFNAMAGSLQQAEQARQAQTADIAHELRNPLTVLQGTLEALADQIYEPTPENLQPALDQVHTLNRLVADLRTLALADAGQLHLNMTPLYLVDVVAGAGNAYRDRLQEKGLTLAIDNTETLPSIQGDVDRLTQVLNNLFSNALRYVPAGCKVNITLHSRSEGVELRFCDNGPGVPDDELTHLFDRFWRAEPSRSRVTGGSGLGLSIAQRIVEAHGGRITAEPTPGGGLTLVLWFPVS